MLKSEGSVVLLGALSCEVRSRYNSLNIKESVIRKCSPPKPARTSASGSPSPGTERGGWAFPRKRAARTDLPPCTAKRRNSASTRNTRSTSLCRRPTSPTTPNSRRRWRLPAGETPSIARSWRTHSKN